jgi:hypothetical protein
MKFQECGPRDELYTWLDPDGGALHFNVTRMREHARACPPEVERITIELGEPYVTFVRASRGVDEAHASALSDAQLHEPTLGVWMKDGTILQVDGHHRTIACWDRGEREIACDVFALGTWERFTIDMPPAIERAARRLVRE